jgi:hypothetical protein
MAMCGSLNGLTGIGLWFPLSTGRKMSVQPESGFTVSPLINQFQAAALVGQFFILSLFNHNQAAAPDNASFFYHQQGLLRQFFFIGRINKDQLKEQFSRQLGCHFSKNIGAAQIQLEQGGPGGGKATVQVGMNELQGLPGLVDKDGKLCATTQCFQAKGSGSRVQIEDPASGK